MTMCPPPMVKIKSLITKELTYIYIQNKGIIRIFVGMREKNMKKSDQFPEINMRGVVGCATNHTCAKAVKELRK